MPASREKDSERERHKLVISLGHRRKKDNASAKCRLGLRAWRSKKPMLSLHAVTDVDGHPLETRTNRAGGYANIVVRFFRHALKASHLHEAILRYVQKAADDIRWESDGNEFEELMAARKESTPGPDGIPYSVYRCAGGSGSQFLYNVYIFIPKSSDVDNNGRIVRSPEALRLLTLCNCDCKILTTAICRGLHWYTMRCIHPSQRCISSRQMTDNIFEIETTALAHVACAPRESGILLTDFAAAYPSVNHSWIFHVLEQAELLEFISRFLRRIYCDSTTLVKFAKNEMLNKGLEKIQAARGYDLAWLSALIGRRNS